MHLSIIIVNWNTRDLLAQCLESVYPNALARPFEVFVVDNASSDGSAEMVRQGFSRVHVIENTQNVGFARANNQAIRRSIGRHLLLLNSDTAIRPQALHDMVQFMENHDEVGLLGPALTDEHGRARESWAAFPTLWSELAGYHSRRRRVFKPHQALAGSLGAYEVDWVAGACMLVRKAVLEQVGLFDERFFLYSEETDLCRRIRAAGWHVVYIPGVRVTHLEGRSSSQVSREASYLLYKSKVQYVRKHFGNRNATILKFGLMARLLTAAAVRALQGEKDLSRSRWRLFKKLQQV